MVTVNETNREPDGTFGALEADTLIGADVENATSDTVPTSQGDGTLAMEAANGGFAGETTEASVTLGGNFTTLSSEPSLLLLNLFLQTDGTTNGTIDVNIDESGGTSPDYTHRSVIDSAAGSGFNVRSNLTVYLPGGAAVFVENKDDPNNINEIVTKRLVTQ